MIGDSHFQTRAVQALRALQAQPELLAAVQAETDAFFARYPEIERTILAMAFIAGLFLERFADAAAQPTAETKKVA